MKLFALVQTRDYKLWFESRNNETALELYKRMRNEFENSTVYIIKGKYVPV